MSLSPSSAVDALLGQAATQYRSGRPAEAEKLYRQVLSSHPDMAQAQAGLALMLYLQGRPQEAIAAFRQAVAIEARDDPARLLELGGRHQRLDLHE